MCREYQRKRGQWADYYTSPQSHIITFFYLLAQQHLTSLTQTFQPLILIYKRGNFVYIIASINRPLSYPFGSMHEYSLLEHSRQRLNLPIECFVAQLLCYLLYRLGYVTTSCKSS